jgi:hypothetical protein
MRCIFLFFVLTLVLTSASFNASAQNSSDYNAVADAFAKLVRQDMMQKKMPDLQEKDAASLIRMLSNAPIFLDSQNYTVKNFLDLARLCQKAGDVELYYLKFDPTRATGPNEDLAVLPTPNLEQVNMNVRKFQDERTPLQIFNLKCVAKEAPLVAQFYAGLKPEQRIPQYVQGTIFSREACFQIFQSSLALVAASAIETAIKEPTRLPIKEATGAAYARALADTAGIFAPGFTLAQRQKNLQLARAAQTAAPARNKADLDKIVEALSRTDCEGVCKL